MVGTATEEEELEFRRRMCTLSIAEVAEYGEDEEEKNISVVDLHLLSGDDHGEEQDGDFFFFAGHEEVMTTRVIIVLNLTINPARIT